MYKKPEDRQPDTKHDFFGPAQARHGPMFIVPGPARPGTSCRAWAATMARRAARPGPNFRILSEMTRYICPPLQPNKNNPGLLTSRVREAFLNKKKNESERPSGSLRIPARRPPDLRLPHPSRAPAARRRWRWRSGHGSARAAAKSRMPRWPAARGRPRKPGARGPGRPVVSADSAVAGACEGCSSTLEAAAAHAATAGAAGGAASSAGGARKQAQGCRRARRPVDAGERDDQQCRGFGRHGHDKILWACAWAEGVTRQAARPGPLAYLCRAKPDPFVPGLGRAARMAIYTRNKSALAINH